VGLLTLPRWKKGEENKDARTAVAKASPDRGKANAGASTVSVLSRRIKVTTILGIVRPALFLCVVAVMLFYVAFWAMAYSMAVDRGRNFFGVVSVNCVPVEALGTYALNMKNGRITHGWQFVDPARRRVPTAYYGESSGVGQAILDLQQHASHIRVGAIGLGVGTLATYARSGDVFRFYEINPEVIRMAEQHFTYLGDCRGKTELVLGDARLSLESEEPQQFDLIVLDAFSGDAIPTHLLTAEAFEIYRRHLAPGGVIAVHVSNNYLRLAPVVRRLASHCGLEVSRIIDLGDESRMQCGSQWMLATRNDRFLKSHPSQPLDWGADDRPAPLWTDQYSNLFQVLVGRQ
jgi:SAM-dependent methyltransferase